jgi:DNA-binding NarL/FixJ family response regulator
MSEAATRILIADDHSTFAELFAMGLEREPDLEAVGHARTAAEAVQLAESLRPDIVIMDVRLGDGDGIEVTAQLTERYADLCVIILTGHPDPAVVARAAQAGACGFLPKGGALAAMLHALRSARRGSLVLPPEMVELMTQPATPPVAAAPTVPSLTAGELEVLELLGHGLNPRTIAARTGLSVEQCRAQLASVMTKLGAHSQLEAVVTANRYGLISVGPDR